MARLCTTFVMPRMFMHDPGPGRPAARRERHVPIHACSGQAGRLGRGARRVTRFHSRSMAAEHRMSPAQAAWSRSTRCVASRPPMDWPAANAGGAPGPPANLARTSPANSA